ncbi:MAG: 50S ribosomal protein L31e [Candidatus Woesearchaeota archaeon]|nr:50S ribosomal protein L31e [Candidatus Woesearchaeota archaeon]
MAEERTYNIPLRRDWLHVPRYKRAKKAVKATKEFLVQHMKSDLKNIRLGKYLNEELWKHGIKNPPHHIKVVVSKDSEGIVRAELSGAPKEEKKAEKKPVKKEAENKEEKKEASPESKPIDAEIKKEIKQSEKPNAQKKE